MLLAVDLARGRRKNKSTGRHLPTEPARASSSGVCSKSEARLSGQPAKKSGAPVSSDEVVAISVEAAAGSCGAQRRSVSTPHALCTTDVLMCLVPSVQHLFCRRWGRVYSGEWGRSHPDRQRLRIFFVRAKRRESERASGPSSAANRNGRECRSPRRLSLTGPKRERIEPHIIGLRALRIVCVVVMMMMMMMMMMCCVLCCVVVGLRCE